MWRIQRPFVWHAGVTRRRSGGCWQCESDGGRARGSYMHPSPASNVGGAGDAGDVGCGPPSAGAHGSD